MSESNDANKKKSGCKLSELYNVVCFFFFDKIELLVSCENVSSIIVSNTRLKVI